MNNSHCKLFMGLILGMSILSLGQSGPASAQGGLGMARQSCPTVNGVADLKEGGAGRGNKAQYWINGFPGKNSECAYTLELCIVGERKETGAKTFITTATGMKMQSSDNILNCDRGWSHFFDGAVAGAQEIMTSLDGNYPVNVRFVGKTSGLK